MMAVLFVLKFHLNDFIGLINIFQGLFLLSEKNSITDLILEPLGVCMRKLYTDADNFMPFM